MNFEEEFAKKIEAKQKWYKDHYCDHAHCPLDCEHPQPFLDGSRLLCGRCFVIFGIESEMLPCTPDICDEK